MSTHANRIDPAWKLVPYERHLVAREFVRQHPYGATQQEVAAAMGCTRQYVDMLERAALRKLQEVCMLQEWRHES